MPDFLEQNVGKRKLTTLIGDVDRNLHNSWILSRKRYTKTDVKNLTCKEKFFMFPLL